MKRRRLWRSMLLARSCWPRPARPRAKDLATLGKRHGRRPQVDFQACTAAIFISPYAAVAEAPPTATPEPQLRPAEPQAGVRDPVNTFDPSVNTWIGPETPPDENWAAWGGGDSNPRPAYSGIGGSGQGGMWHGGALRMFLFGNGSFGEYLRTGAQELCGGFGDWCPPVADAAPAYRAQVFRPTTSTARSPTARPDRMATVARSTDSILQRRYHGSINMGSAPSSA